MRQKYDEFYQSTNNTPFRDMAVPNWPNDRVQAILFQARGGEAVLDVGCGDGHLLYQLRKRFKNLIGLEYSPHRLKEAVGHLSTLPFQGLLGSAEAIPLDAHSVDCIVSADTIEHIPDVYQAVEEFYRVLKPGGRIVLNTPNIAFIKKRLLLLLGRFPSTSQPNEGMGSDVLFDGGHLHYFTFRSLALLLERAGFSVESRIGYGKFGRVHNVYPPLLSGGVQIVARKK